MISDFNVSSKYQYPPINLLYRSQTSSINEDEASRAQDLEETLQAFKVKASVKMVTYGPAVTGFALELKAGTKGKKILELEREIARGLKSPTVRIVDPIPGTDLIGIEVPSLVARDVPLRDVLESDSMESSDLTLPLALGLDITGNSVVCDLIKMPHLLIAGASFTGKSTCLHSMIISLLYRTNPNEVKFIMIDPRGMEMRCYNAIPHMLIPVVTDSQQAVNCLTYACAEMNRRYDCFTEAKVRNITGYNQQLDSCKRPMARMVIIIDDLAPLMKSCKADIEKSIICLTQQGWAAGIHLIVTTKTCSADVLTGSIKANLPSRIAFKTASAADSRAILDKSGAEQLLSPGDMLYSPTGVFIPARVQGCYVDAAEIQKITDMIRQTNYASYDQDVLRFLDELENAQAPSQPVEVASSPQALEDDTAVLFKQAVEIAIRDGQISTPTLQRQLRIGYSRAGRIIDMLTDWAIISEKDGSRPRRCLITQAEWDEIQNR